MYHSALVTTKKLKLIILRLRYSTHLEMFCNVLFGAIVITTLSSVAPITSSSAVVVIGALLEPSRANATEEVRNKKEN